MLIALSLASTTLLTPLPAATVLEEEKAPEVKLELLADTTHLKPGAEFRLGVRFKIFAEHWHIYWENPGESGLATEIEVQAPEGFEVGKPLFPAPRSFSMAGDITTYGYEREVLIFVPVTAPGSLTAGDNLEFGVAARWLVCKEVCFLGEGEATLKIPTAPDGNQMRAANETVFARYAMRLPRPWKELGGVDFQMDGTPERPRLELKVAQAVELEFFPHYSDAITLKAHTNQRARASATLALGFDIETEGPKPDSVSGVLRVRKRTGEAFYLADLALPSAEKQ